MATKKVEEKSNKSKNSSNKNNINKNEKNIKKTSVKKDNAKKTASKKNTKKVVDEKIKCEECGQYYLASLGKCPNCFPKDEEFDIDEFEEYDDEDELELENKKQEQKKVKEHKSNKISKKRKNKSNEVIGGTFKEQNADLFNLIKIIIVVVVLVVVIYLIVAFLNGDFKDKKANDSDNETPATIQNEKILASSIFDKADKEYYVLIYDSDNVWGEYFSTLYSNYTSIQSDEVKPLFWVDLNDYFNREVIVKEDEKTNKKAQNFDELKVKSPTLIHIKDGENIEYKEDDAVADTLSKIIKDHSEDTTTVEE